MGTKILPRNRLVPTIKNLKASGKKIVFTNGCFDLLHPGHIKILKQAKTHGDVLIVGLNSDKSIQRLKGPTRPILNQQSRSELIASIIFVDFVVVFTEPTPLRLIKIIKPDVLVKGGDWQKERIVGADFVQAYGGKVVRVPLKETFSTSALIAKILAASSTKNSGA